jgi:hypothetical protein
MHRGSPVVVAMAVIAVVKGRGLKVSPSASDAGCSGWEDQGVWAVGLRVGANLTWM